MELKLSTASCMRVEVDVSTSSQAMALSTTLDATDELANRPMPKNALVFTSVIFRIKARE